MGIVNLPTENDCRADPSYRGVLPSLCPWMWSDATITLYKINKKRVSLSQLYLKKYLFIQLHVLIPTEPSTPTWVGRRGKGKGSLYNRLLRPLGRGVSTTLQPLYHRKRPGTHCIGGWVGPRTGLEGCGKSRAHRDSNPDRSTRSESLYRLSYPGRQVEED